MAGDRGFGVRLKGLRERRGWNQRGVPDFSGQQIGPWEAGRAFPRPADLVRLADLFGVTTDYLLRGEAGSDGGPGARDPQGVLTLVPRADGPDCDFPLQTPVRLLGAGEVYGEPIDAAAIVRAPDPAEPLRRQWPAWLVPGDLLLLRTVVSASLPEPRPAPVGAWCLKVQHDLSGPEYRLFQAGPAPTRSPRDFSDGPAWICDAVDGPGGLAAVAQGGAVYQILHVVRSVDTVAGLGGVAPPSPTIEAFSAAAGIPTALLRAAVTALRPGRAPVGSAGSPLDRAEDHAARGFAALTIGTEEGRWADVLRAFAREVAQAVAAAEPEPTDLATQAEVARLLGVSRQAINQAVKSGRLPAFRRGTDELVSLRDARMLVGGGRGHVAAPASEQPETPGRLRASDIPEIPREWVPWVDAEPDDTTYARFEQDPPADTPPPWDYAHYDAYETVRSAAYGLQWWEYPEEGKRKQFADFVRRMETMYREQPENRGKLWLESRTELGPHAPMPPKEAQPGS